MGARCTCHRTRRSARRRDHLSAAVRLGGRRLHARRRGARGGARRRSGRWRRRQVGPHRDRPVFRRKLRRPGTGAREHRHRERRVGAGGQRCHRCVMTGHVIVTDDGSIRILRLNRPEKKNALTDAMYETLSEALENAAVSKVIRCIVVAAMDARFSTPFVNLGLVPEAGSSLLMPRLMGTRRAFELLVMGHPLDADQAMAVGLVNAVVPAGEVEPEAMKAARQIAALPAEAVAASRRLIRGSTAEIVRRIDEESEIFKQRLKSDEAKAAFEAFLTRKG